MTPPPLSLSTLALALYDEAQRHGARPTRITLPQGMRDALLREVFGDTEPRDLRAALGLEVHVDEAFPPDEFRLE